MGGHWGACAARHYLARHQCLLSESCGQVLTKAATAAVLNAGGDVFSQLYIEKTSRFDWKRLGVFTLLVRPALCLQAVQGIRY